MNTQQKERKENKQAVHTQQKARKAKLLLIDIQSWSEAECGGE